MKHSEYKGIYIAAGLMIIVIAWMLIKGSKSPHRDRTENSTFNEQQTTVSSSVPSFVPEINIYANSKLQDSIMRECVNILKSTCVHIKNYLPVSKTDVYYDTNNLDYRREKYGWKKQVRIEIHIMEDMNRIPVDMAGQMLNYYMGAGKRTGVYVVKPQSQQLCGSDKVDENGDDILIPIQKLNL